MDNDEIRSLLKEKNITADNVSKKQLMELHDILNDKLENCGCFRGTFRMNSLELDENIKYMTCKSDYFDSREAVSFNRDGFIGMAGWASSTNIQPIRLGVVEWANKIMPSQIIGG